MLRVHLTSTGSRRGTSLARGNPKEFSARCVKPRFLHPNKETGALFGTKDFTHSLTSRTVYVTSRNTIAVIGCSAQSVMHIHIFSERGSRGRHLWDTIGCAKTLQQNRFLFKMVYKHRMINISVLKAQWDVRAYLGKDHCYGVGLY